MNKIIFPALLLLAGCQNAKTEDNAANSNGPAHTDHQQFMANANDLIDPVCGMVKDSTWTAFSLYKGDTVWFCAATEKRVFDANPGKYAPKINRK